MSNFEIPTVQGSQRLTITLSGVQYRLSIKWNDICNGYVLDIGDSDGVPILSGLPIVAGIDMLAQYEYLNFNGQLIAQTDFNAELPPDYENLGTTGRIYWVTR